CPLLPQPCLYVAVEGGAIVDAAHDLFLPLQQLLMRKCSLPLSDDGVEFFLHVCSHKNLPTAAATPCENAGAPDGDDSIGLTEVAKLLQKNCKTFLIRRSGLTMRPR